VDPTNESINKLHKKTEIRMGTETCYSCGKEVEVDDDELDDTLEVETEGEEAEDKEWSANDVLLCSDCKDKFLKAAEKARTRK
jgi:DNA-directed RNA polymerase subunit RPC12/RpoP